MFKGNYDIFHCDLSFLFLLRIAHYDHFHFQANYKRNKSFTLTN